MSTTEKLIKARMGMLALAEQLNNVSAACRRAGISRSHYYEIKEAFEKFGSVLMARSGLAQKVFFTAQSEAVDAKSPEL